MQHKNVLTQITQTLQQIPPPQQHLDFVTVEMPYDHYEFELQYNLYAYIQEYSETILPFNLEYFVLDKSPDVEKDENGFYFYCSNKSTVYINKNGELDDTGYPIWVQALPTAENSDLQGIIQEILSEELENPSDYKWYLAYSKN